MAQRYNPSTGAMTKTVVGAEQKVTGPVQILVGPEQKIFGPVQNLIGPEQKANIGLGKGCVYRHTYSVIYASTRSSISDSMDRQLNGTEIY